MHTNQKRFQCERPREKRAVLRERKEALGSPVNKVDRVEGRSWFRRPIGLFQNKPTVGLPVECVFSCGTLVQQQVIEHVSQHKMCFLHACQSTVHYIGAKNVDPKNKKSAIKR